MFVGMVADDVPLPDHPRNDLRAALHIWSGDKKRGRDLLFPEDIQNFFRIPVLIPAVKGEVNHLFPARIKGESAVLGIELLIIL